MQINFTIKQDYFNDRLNFLIYTSCAGYLESSMHEPIEQILESMQNLIFENAEFYFKRSKFLIVVPITDINTFDAVPITDFFLNTFSQLCGAAQAKFLGLKLYSPLIESLKTDIDQAIDQMNEVFKDKIIGQIRSERRWMSGCRYIDYVNGSKSVPIWTGWGFVLRDSQLFAGLLLHVKNSIKGESLIEQMEKLSKNNSEWDLKIVGEAESSNYEWILNENHNFLLSASTEHSKPHTAAHALMSNRKTYWAAKIKNSEQWWQLESKDPLTFSKLKFTGAPHGQSYMQEFKISYSMDGSNWENLELFEGIYEGSELKEIKFNESFNARKIRVIPTKYVGWPGFRIDFYAKRLMPKKVELQWLKAINSKDDIELTMKNIEHKLEELKNLEGASI